MRRDKAVGPEWNTAFSQPGFDLLSGWLKNGSASDHHLEFSIHSSQACQNSFPNFAYEPYGQATGFTLGRNAVFGEARWSQFSCQRGRTRSVADDFDLFVLRVDMLEVSIVHAFLAELGQEEDRQGSIEIAQRRSSTPIFQHHSLCKTGCGIVVSQTREILDRIEVEPLSFHSFLQGKIEANRSLVDNTRIRSLAEQGLQPWGECPKFFLRDRPCSAHEFGGVAGIYVHPEYAHPLRRVGDTAGLAHASAPEGSQGGEVQPVLQVSGARITHDLLNRLTVVRSTVNEFVRNADLEQAAVHDESTHGAPSLGAGMSPKQYPFPSAGVIANGANQVSCPCPRAGKEDHCIHLRVIFHSA